LTGLRPGTTYHVQPRSADVADNPSSCDDFTFTTSALNFSLRFDGSSGYADVATAADLNITADWTIEAWFRDDDPNGFNHPRRTNLSNGDTAATPDVPYLVQVGENNNIAGLRSAGVNSFVTWDLNALGLKAKDWHHVAVAFNAAASNLNLWLDGRHITYLTIPAHTRSGSALPLDIGRKGPCPATTGWASDDVRNWSAARPGSAISATFQSQLNGPQPNLVAN